MTGEKMILRASFANVMKRCQNSLTPTSLKRVQEIQGEFQEADRADNVSVMRNKIDQLLEFVI